MTSSIGQRTGGPPPGDAFERGQCRNVVKQKEGERGGKRSQAGVKKKGRKNNNNKKLARIRQGDGGRTQCQYRGRGKHPKKGKKKIRRSFTHGCAHLPFFCSVNSVRAEVRLRLQQRGRMNKEWTGKSRRNRHKGQPYVQVTLIQPGHHHPSRHQPSSNRLVAVGFGPALLCVCGVVDDGNQPDGWMDGYRRKKEGPSEERERETKLAGIAVHKPKTQSSRVGERRKQRERQNKEKQRGKG